MRVGLIGSLAMGMVKGRWRWRWRWIVFLFRERFLGEGVEEEVDSLYFFPLPLIELKISQRLADWLFPSLPSPTQFSYIHTPIL